MFCIFFLALAREGLVICRDVLLSEFGLNLNLTARLYQLLDWDGVLTYHGLALGVDPAAVKALYRMGCIGATEELIWLSISKGGLRRLSRTQKVLARRGLKSRRVVEDTVAPVAHVHHQLWPQ